MVYVDGLARRSVHSEAPPATFDEVDDRLVWPRVRRFR
jgi:hypothetical protein